MSHKETILYSLKMIDNLVRKLMDRHITADKQGLTIMHTWIVGFLYNNPDRAVYQRDIEREFRVNRGDGIRHDLPDGTEGTDPAG